MKIKKIENQIRNIYIELLKVDNTNDTEYIDFIKNVTSDISVCYFDFKLIKKYISKINNIFQKYNGEGCINEKIKY